MSVALLLFVRIITGYITFLPGTEYHLHPCVKLLVMADDQPQAPAYTLPQNCRDLFGMVSLHLPSAGQIERAAHTCYRTAAIVRAIPETAESLPEQIEAEEWTVCIRCQFQRAG